MAKAMLLPLLSSVFILLADARTAPNSPLKSDPCTITITLPPFQAITQVPTVTLTLDEHANFVKAEQQAASVIPPIQPTSSQEVRSGSSQHTDKDVSTIRESEYPLSTAFFKPSPTFESTPSSSAAETAPLNATSTENPMMVHSKITQTHSVITFSTQARSKVSSITSGSGADYGLQKSSKTIEGSTIATSSDASTVISPAYSQSDEISLPAVPTKAKVVVSSSSTASFQDSGAQLTSSLSVEAIPTQVSSATSSLVANSWKAVLSFVAVILIFVH